MPIRYLKYGLSANSLITTSLIGFCLFPATNSHAAEYQYLVEATGSVERIENARRSSSSGQDELLLEQRLRGTLSRATSKLVTNIDYQGAKYNYRNNLQTDRSLITGSSSIDWLISPERLSWNLSNTRSLQVVNSLLPDTLDNRQVISVTSTGPRVTFQLSGRNKLSGSVNYSIAEYERSLLSGQDRIAANLLFSHNFSTSFISSLGANYLQSELDDDPAFGFPNLDFERYEYFWQNEYITEIINLNLMVGQNVLMRDDFDDQENILTRLTGSYKVNSQSTVEFNYSDSYEDIFSNILSSPIAAPNQVIGDRLGNSFLNQNYELVQRGIGYIYTRSEFFGMNFRYSEAERTYTGLETDLNQFDKVYHAGANWDLYTNLNLSVYGRYTEQEFTDIDREQERKEYGLQAGYRISKSLYTRFSIFNVDQSGNLPVDNYDGLNYSLSLTLAIGNQ